LPKNFNLKKLEKKTLNPMLLSPFLKTKGTYVIYTLIFLVMKRPMEVAPITFEKLKKRKREKCCTWKMRGGVGGGYYNLIIKYIIFLFIFAKEIILLYFIF